MLCSSGVTFGKLLHSSAVCKAGAGLGDVRFLLPWILLGGPELQLSSGCEWPV